MHDRTVRNMSLEELRSRVEEAEKILRVARRLAQDELRDPASSERAKHRIASLCNDVSALFPGLGEPLAQMPDAAPAGAEAGKDSTADLEADEAADDDAEEDEEGEEDEWDVDYDKLRAALGNPELMGRFPEGERAEFKAMAEQLLEAHDRHLLLARITEGFAQLEETTREGAEKVRRQLEFALTLEELRSKTRD